MLFSRLWGLLAYSVTRQTNYELRIALRMMTDDRTSEINFYDIEKSN